MAEYGLGERVVMDLCQPLINSKCLVAFDNFFTSDKLMRMLLNDGIYSIGTVRTDRKELPNMLKTKEKLSRGEFMFSVKGAVAATKWQDSKPVTIISTTKLISRKNKDGSKSEVYCPEAVKIYNSIMGGVDRFDQKKERYEVGRRSTKWWHRIFYYLLDLAIVNAYTIMNVVKNGGDQLTFRLRFARQLIAGFSTRKRKGRQPLFIKKKTGSIGVPVEVRTANVGNHLPKQLQTYRRCRSRIECAGCRVA
jgi:hypothetical protein